jgi:hypothetical protein
MNPAHAEVDDLQHVDLEVLEVLVDRQSHVVLGQCVQGLRDELVDEERPVEVRGVDVVHTEFDGPAQNRDRLIRVGGRSHHAGTCELHRAVADAVDDPVSQDEGAGG